MCVHPAMGAVPITVARGGTVRHAGGNGRAVATRAPNVPTTVARGRTVSRTGCGACGPVPITVARGDTVRHAGGTARAVATSGISQTPLVGSLKITTRKLVPDWCTNHR